MVDAEFPYTSIICDSESLLLKFSLFSGTDYLPYRLWRAQRGKELLGICYRYGFHIATAPNMPFFWKCFINENFFLKKASYALRNYFEIQISTW